MADNLFRDVPQCSNQTDVSLTYASDLETRGKLLRILSGYLLINVLYCISNLYILYIHYYIHHELSTTMHCCRGICVHCNDFRLLCDKYNLIVCCLQETMLTTVQKIF